MQHIRHLRGWKLLPGLAGASDLQLQHESLRPKHALRAIRARRIKLLQNLRLCPVLRVDRTGATEKNNRHAGARVCNIIDKSPRKAMEERHTRGVWGQLGRNGRRSTDRQTQQMGRVMAPNERRGSQ